MRRKIIVSFVVTAILILFGIDPGLALSSVKQSLFQAVDIDNASPAMAPWFIDTLDTSTDVGEHVSAAVDAQSGEVCISYYDAENEDLRMMRFVGSGGDCGPSNAWKCDLVDSFGDVGQYNSTASCPSDNGAALNVTYYDATNGALKYAWGTCDQNNDCTYTTRSIDKGNPDLFTFKGQHTSVKLDSKGNPHVAYHRSSGLSSDALMYARWVGGGGGNCGFGDVAGDWQCTAIHAVDGVGKYTSLDIDGQDRPSIAYYNESGEHPWVATLVGSGGNCGPSADWMCWRVDHDNLDTGKFVSLYVEESGEAHIAYYNETEGTLEYAKWVGSGGNCGVNMAFSIKEWQCEWIDDMGISLKDEPLVGISIAEDGAGYPIIAYQDASDDPSQAALKLARPHAALDLNVVPNCGPQKLFYKWFCDVIDAGPSFYDSEAGSVSLVMNSASLATIAYHEKDSYAVPVQGNLKVAYQRLQLFLPLAIKE